MGDEESDGGFAVAPGRYHLLARGPGSELWFEEVDLSEDSTVDLEHSELVEVRLHLTFLDRPVASTPVAIAPVDVDASEDWFMSDLVTSPDGVLDLRLPSGRYRIWTPQSLAAEVEIPTGGGLRFVALGSP